MQAKTLHKHVFAGEQQTIDILMLGHLYIYIYIKWTKKILHLLW